LQVKRQQRCSSGRRRKRPAQAAGASIVDLSGALEGQPGVIVRTPFVEGGQSPDLTTVAVVPAHAAAIMLALASAKLQPLGLSRLVATVLQPASELGRAGVEEMHQQTVALLSFKPLKKDSYDAQVAFNLLAALGQSAKVDLEAETAKIMSHVESTGGAAGLAPIALQLIHAPVFHGYAASIFVELNKETTKEALSRALQGGRLGLMEETSPSNETAAGKPEVLFHIAANSSHERSAFWLWLASDNLRLVARNAVTCSMELVDLRPTSDVN
jgi:aspartate-semialdehyde dehydrogenase